MADRIWRGDAVAVAQVVTVTPGTIVSGREYALRINGKRVAVTASGTTAAGLVSLLVAAVNASTIPEWREVVASGSATLILTSRAAGVPFIVYPEVGGFVTNGSVQVTVRNSPTGGTWLFDAGSYGSVNVTYNSSAASMQTQMDSLFGSGNTVVTKEVAGTDLIYRVEFTGSFAASAIPDVEVSYANLTGGDAALVIETTQEAVAGTDEEQTITFVAASAGTFKLTFGGYQTAALAYNVSTASLETALEGLAAIGSGNVAVTGSAGSSYVVAFQGALAHQNVPLIEIDASALTVARASVAVTTEGDSGSATSVGPLVAGSGASVADPASAYYPYWEYPGRVTVDDGSGAYCVSSIGSTSPTEFLVATNFGFAIPGTSTILGIEVSESRYCPMTNGSYDRSVKLTVDGVTGSGTDHSATDAWATSFGTKTWGGAADLWGLALTPAIVNSPNFGVVLQATLNGSSYPGYVDWIKIKAYYSDPTTGVNEVQTLSITGSPSSGDFDLVFDGQPTARLPYNATAAAVQTALRALSNIGATGVTCSGGALPGTDVVITFGGTLAYTDVSLIVARNYEIGYKIETTTPGVTGLNEIQKLSLTGQDVWGGTLTLTWSGQTTGAIDFDGTSSEVSAALVALSNIAPGEVSVTGGPWPELPIYVEWTGANAETDVAAITSSPTLKNGVADGLVYQPLIAETTVRATGPNHWNEGVNWYNPTSPSETRCPERHDKVWLTEGSIDILYGLVQVVTFTVDTAAEWLIPGTAHDLVEGQIVEVWSTTTLPSGLSAATAYYVMDLDAVTGKFKLSTTAGGAAVNITSAGSGTHRVGVRLDKWFQSAKYTGNVGLPWTNEAEYKEYRPLYVTIGFDASGTNSVTIGQGDGSGSSRVNINTGTDALALFEVLNSGGSRETGIPAVNWLGTNAVTVLQVLGGDLGVALRATETAQFASLVIREGTVGLGTVSFVSLDQTGGTLSPVEAATISGAVKVRG